MDKTVVFTHLPEGSIRLALSRAQMREIVRGYEREAQQEIDAHYAEEQE